MKTSVDLRQFVPPMSRFLFVDSAWFAVTFPARCDGLIATTFLERVGPDNFE